MLSIVQSMGLHGIDGYLINVEVDVSAGMPSFDVVRTTRCKCKRI